MRLKVSEVISDALELINVPGQGAILPATEQNAAFRALQKMLSASAVSKLFTPGITQHFFNMVVGKSIYTYGPGGDFDTDDFYHPAPIRVMDAYIRAGSSITNNEQVQNPTFALSTGWTAGSGWTIANNMAKIASGNNGSQLTQTLSLTAGVTYTIIVKTAHRGGSVSFVVNQAGSAILTQTINGSGEYEFEVGFAGGSSDLAITADADADMDITSVSIIEKGKAKVSLPDARGSDYHVAVMDRAEYNRKFTKGTGGRPYNIHYNRLAGTGELLLDNSSIAGDILIMDVQVNTVEIVSLSQTLNVNDDALEWITYALADRRAGPNGKQLKPDQRLIMRRAHNLLKAGNTSKLDNLRVDSGLQQRQSFDINRGDP